jgi:hypothetical protein
MNSNLRTHKQHIASLTNLRTRYAEQTDAMRERAARLPRVGVNADCAKSTNPLLSSQKKDENSGD